MFTNVENKEWKKAFAKAVVLGLGLGTLCILCCYFIRFCYRYIEYIAIGIGGVLAIIWGIYFILSKFKDLFNKKDNTPPQPNTPTTVHYDPVTLENTYKLLRAGLCTVVGEIGELINVRKPASYTQLDAPTNYTIVANAPIYHLLLNKIGTECDTYEVHGILQTVIEQKLNNFAFPGISQSTFFYNSQAYPLIMIDDVKDLGQFIQVDMALANEYYCRYREQKLFKSVNASPINVELDDTDF